MNLFTALKILGPVGLCVAMGGGTAAAANAQGVAACPGAAPPPLGGTFRPCGVP